MQRLKRKIISCGDKGMTLVETLVAVSIFLLVMAAIMQMFVSAVRLERSFLAKSESMSEASYLMEYISRAVRMAKKDALNLCGNGVNANFGQPSGIGTSLSFLMYNGTMCQEFYKQGTALYEKKVAGGNTIINALTSSALEVAAFNVAGLGWYGAGVGDYDQPRVTVSLQLKDKTQSSFILQTTVSQRNPDLGR